MRLEILTLAVPLFCGHALSTSFLILSVSISSKFLVLLRYIGVFDDILICGDRLDFVRVIFPSLVEPATEVSLHLLLASQFVKPVLQLQSFLVLWEIIHPTQSIRWHSLSVSSAHVLPGRDLVVVGGLELAELLHVADHWLHRRVGELYGIALGGE